MSDQRVAGPPAVVAPRPSSGQLVRPSQLDGEGRACPQAPRYEPGRDRHIRSAPDRHVRSYAHTRDSIGALHHLSGSGAGAGADGGPERLEAAVRTGDQAAARIWMTEDLAGSPAPPAGRGRSSRWLTDASERPAEAMLRPYSTGRWAPSSGRSSDRRRAHPADLRGSGCDAGNAGLTPACACGSRPSGRQAGRTSQIWSCLHREKPTQACPLRPGHAHANRASDRPAGECGLSSKEGAAQCWISPRTMAFHLRNVFAKSGVTSRGGWPESPLVCRHELKLRAAPVGRSSQIRGDLQVLLRCTSGRCCRR